MTINTIGMRGVNSGSGACSRLVLLLALAAGLSACRPAVAPQRTFATPEEAVRALNDAVKRGAVEELIAIFGPEGKELAASSDPVAARRNREVFVAATAERWSLADEGTNTKTLVVGNEEWPFPIPLVRDARGWHFDTAAGKEEVIARRIGRNELGAIRVCRVYVAAQRLYAESGHDGEPAGLYARTVRSDPGRHNGLYWPASTGQKRSPLGDLIAGAAQDVRPPRQDAAEQSPFHGYFFRILTRQGPSADGGARDYVVAGRMSGGFALVAWPAQYDVTGIMTFLVNGDGVVREKDLGPDTNALARGLSLYDPDASWAPVR